MVLFVVFVHPLPFCPPPPEFIFSLTPKKHFFLRFYDANRWQKEQGEWSINNTINIIVKRCIRVQIRVYYAQGANGMLIYMSLLLLVLMLVLLPYYEIVMLLSESSLCHYQWCCYNAIMLLDRLTSILRFGLYRV